MARGIIGGMTDYSHQSFMDIINDLEDYLSLLNSYVDRIVKNKSSIEDYWKNKVQTDFRHIYSYSLKFYDTAIEEIKDIFPQIQVEVANNHIKRLFSIAKTAQEINVDIGKVWHQEYKRKEYGNKDFFIVEQIYADTRDLAVSLLDISNIAERLNDFIGKKPTINKGNLKDIENVASNNDNSCDFVIIVATQLELNKLSEIISDFKEIDKISNDTSIYYSGFISNDTKSIKVVITKSPFQGSVASSCSATKLVFRFKPKYIFMIGIAAGIKGGPKIGDILIAETSIDYNFVVKNQNNEGILTNKKMDTGITIDGNTKNRIDKYVKDTQLLGSIKASYSDNEKFDYELRCHLGILATGNSLLRSKDEIERLVKEYKGVIGIDMETYGIYYSAKNTYDNTLKYISIKSVSDFGTNEKDKIKPDERANYAIHTSVMFFKNYILSEY